MKVLGITGGVGAGKSMVLSYLSEKYHAKVIQTDHVAHFLQKPGQECHQKIVECFGDSILNDQGEIVREELGKIVFFGGEFMKELNNIMQSAVKQFVLEEVEKEKIKKEVPFVVIEAALLLENHYEVCDEIWYIYADQETRKKRLMKSRGYSEKKTESIMKNQLSEKEFYDGCQFVIDNNDDFMENTYRQIDEGLVKHGFL